MADALPAARLAAYLAALDAGAFEAAAAQFTPSVEYVRGPINPGERGLQRIVGRDALHASFVERGSRSYRHHLTACFADGLRCIGHGEILDDEPERILFFSYVEVDAETGQIASYVASTVGRPAPG